MEIKYTGANRLKICFPSLSLRTVMRIRRMISNARAGANSWKFAIRVPTPSRVNSKSSPVMTPVEETAINTPMPPMKPTNTWLGK